MRLLSLRAIATTAVAIVTVAAAAGDSAVVPQSRPVLWAWERPEDLRFAGPDFDVAVLAGSIVLSGDLVGVTGRRYPAYVLPKQHVVGVVHVEIDHRRPLVWSPMQRDETIARIRSLTDNERFSEIQIDFEVRASERPVLLDVLHGVHSGLAARRALSMTALASWCDTERWLASAPVGEIVPMLFRMGPPGEDLKRRLATGGDFADRHCRGSVGIAVDTPPNGLPAGRRVYIFNAQSWNREALDGILRNIAK
jgi:hypothetical protein